MEKDIIVVSNLHKLDDSRIYHNEICSLISSGFNVTYITSDIIDDRIDAHKALKVKTFKVSGGRVLGSLQFQFRLLREYKGFKGVFMFHDPELLLCALVLKIFFRKTIIFDSHEDLPRQILTKPYNKGLNRYLLKAVIHIIVTIYGIIDYHICATPEIKRVMERYKKPIFVAYNYPDFKNIERTTTVDNRHVLTYIGGVSKIRGYDMLNILSKDFNLLVAGPLVDINQSDLASSKVKYLGVLRRTLVVNLLSSTGIGLCLLHPTPAYSKSIPIKIMEYLSMGIPVICTDIPYWRELFEWTGACVFVEYGNIGKMYEQVHWLQKENNWEKAHNNALNCRGSFSWLSIEKEFISFVSNAYSNS